GAAAAAGGVLLGELPAAAGVVDQAGAANAAANAQTSAAPPVVLDDPTKVPGPPTTAVGTRSPFFAPARTPVGEITGTALAPIHELTGTLTPADLHFTRIHAGIPTIDPTKHRLLIHGLVDRPLEFS